MEWSWDCLDQFLWRILLESLWANQLGSVSSKLSYQIIGWLCKLPSSPSIELGPLNWGPKIPVPCIVSSCLVWLDRILFWDFRPPQGQMIKYFLERISPLLWIYLCPPENSIDVVLFTVVQLKAKVLVLTVLKHLYPVKKDRNASCGPWKGTLQLWFHLLGPQASCLSHWSLAKAAHATRSWSMALPWQALSEYII